MEKKFGNNKAGYHSRNKTVTMIVSILAVTLFIGIAMQPVIAEPISVKKSELQAYEEECKPCKAAEQPQTILPCASCKCAVKFAVDYGLKYAKGEIDKKMEETNGKIYSGFFVDLVLWIRTGVLKGFEESGYDFDVDIVKLTEEIEYWVNKKIDIPEHDLAKIVAALSGIFKGLGVYLIELCGGKPKTLYEPPITQITSPDLPIIYKIIVFLYKLLHIGK
jgi:hypothetical protein